MSRVDISSFNEDDIALLNNHELKKLFLEVTNLILIKIG